MNSLDGIRRSALAEDTATEGLQDQTARPLDLGTWRSSSGNASQHLPAVPRRLPASCGLDADRRAGAVSSGRAKHLPPLRSTGRGRTILPCPMA